MPTSDDLVTMIGSPPTAQGVAAAILAATTPPPVAEPAPDDHGLDPADPAVTQVPRDETTPTPGVDLPAVDPVPTPTVTGGQGDDSFSGGAGDDTLVTSPVEDFDAEIAADEADVQHDEDKLTADENKLEADQARKGG